LDMEYPHDWQLGKSKQWRTDPGRPYAWRAGKSGGYADDTVSGGRRFRPSTGAGEAALAGKLKQKMAGFKPAVSAKKAISQVVSSLKGEIKARQQTDATLQRALAGAAQSLADRDAAIVGELRQVTDQGDNTGTQISVNLATETAARKQNDNELIADMSRLRDENMAKLKVAMVGFKALRDKIVSAAQSSQRKKAKAALAYAIRKLDAQRQAKLQQTLAEVDQKRAIALHKRLGELQTYVKSTKVKLDSQETAATTKEIRKRQKQDVELQAQVNKDNLDAQRALALESRVRKSADVSEEASRKIAIAGIGKRLAAVMRKELAAMDLADQQALKSATSKLQTTETSDLTAATKELAKTSAKVAKAFDTKRTRLLKAEEQERKSADKNANKRLRKGVAAAKAALAAEEKVRHKGDQQRSKDRTAAFNQLSKKLTAEFDADIKKLAKAGDGTLDTEGAVRAKEDRKLSATIVALQKADATALKSEANARRSQESSADKARTSLRNSVNGKLSKLDGAREAVLSKESAALARADKALVAGAAAAQKAVKAKTRKEANQRSSADSAETKERSKSDNALSTRVDTVTKKMSQTVAAETGVRTKGDKEITRESQDEDDELLDDLERNEKQRGTADKAARAALKKDVANVESKANTALKTKLKKMDAEREAAIKKDIAEMDEVREAKLKAAVKKKSDERKVDNDKLIIQEDKTLRAAINLATSQRKDGDKKVGTVLSSKLQDFQALVKTADKQRREGDARQGRLRGKDVAEASKAISRISKKVAGAETAEERSRKSGDQGVSDIADQRKAQVVSLLDGEKKQRSEGDTQVAAKRKKLVVDSEDRLMKKDNDGIKKAKAGRQQKLTSTMESFVQGRDKLRSKQLSAANGKVSQDLSAEVRAEKTKLGTTVNKEQRARRAADSDAGSALRQSEARSMKALKAGQGAVESALEAEAKERKRVGSEHQAEVTKLGNAQKKLVGRMGEARASHDKSLTKEVQAVAGRVTRGLKAETSMRAKGDRGLTRLVEGERQAVEADMKKREGAQTEALTGEESKRKSEDDAIRKDLEKEAADLEREIKKEAYERDRADRGEAKLVATVDNEQAEAEKTLQAAQTLEAEESSDLDAEQTQEQKLERASLEEQTVEAELDATTPSE